MKIKEAKEQIEMNPIERIQELKTKEFNFELGVWKMEGKKIKEKDRQLIQKVNEIIREYNIHYNNFKNVDRQIVDKLFFKNRLKEQRYKIFLKLKESRGKIIQLEKEYGLYLGESPHCSFTEVVNGGYGSKLSRAYGDLGYLNESGYFPFIAHELTEMNYHFLRSKPILLPFEMGVMSDS